MEESGEIGAPATQRLAPSGCVPGAPADTRDPLPNPQTVGALSHPIFEASVHTRTSNLGGRWQNGVPDL